MSVAKTFLLGVGCPKSGTSWLHDYLSEQPVAEFGFAKEYHVFDSLYVPDCKKFSDEVLASVKALANSNSLLTLNHPHLFKRLDFLRDTNNYFDYFYSLARKNDKTKLVGDLTPSYCALPPEAFQYIRSKLCERGFQIRVLFVMRDPFERIWSALRMKRFKDRRYRDSAGESKQLEEYFVTPKVEIRSRYENTIENLKKTFRPNEIHFQIYEEMITEVGMREVTQFIGIPYSPPDFGKLVNASEKNEGLSPGLEAQIVAYYRDTYEAAEQLFGSNRLERCWPSFTRYQKLD
ncbi:MAG: hypothetical protein ACJAYC_002511 [Halieaceae bacterium]